MRSEYNILTKLFFIKLLENALVNSNNIPFDVYFII